MKNISVIVPVYNTEKYLERCLSSIVNQTILKLLDIIIINDGTNDNSEEIILSFIKRYPDNFKYYKKDNGGISSARNYGINKCNTEYIGFVDSDDYIKENMFELMYNMIKKENCDVVSCGVVKCNDNGYIRGYEQVGVREIKLNRSQSIKYVLNNKIKGYCWNKLYKTELFKKNNIMYPEGRLMYEDFLVCYKIMKKVKSVYLINDPLYNYVQHSNSICHNPSLDTARDIILTLDDILKDGSANNGFIANMILYSNVAYYRWYYSERDIELKRNEILNYNNKVEFYKDKVNILRLVLDNNVDICIKIKYLMLHFNLLKYIYFFITKAELLKLRTIV